MDYDQAFDVANMQIRWLSDPAFRTLHISPSSASEAPGPMYSYEDFTQYTQIFRTTFSILRVKVEAGLFWKKAATYFHQHCFAISHCCMYGKAAQHTQGAQIFRSMAGVRDMMLSGRWRYPMAYSLAALKSRAFYMRRPEGLNGIYSNGPYVRCSMLSEVALDAHPVHHPRIGGERTSPNCIQSIYEDYRKEWGACPRMVN